MNVVTAPASSASTVVRRIRVMIVDDAVVVRGLFARWVEAEPDLEMVATIRSGREAVNQLERYDPDVVLLDIEMPDLDGITALPMLLAKKRDLVVIMASTLTRRNAEISLRALSLGAADYIPKPASSREVTSDTNFRRELIEKVRQLGLRAKRVRVAPSVPARAPVADPKLATPLIKTASPQLVPGATPALAIALRPFAIAAPRVLLIGASTGGPQALNALMPQLAGVFERAPVLITQHMPPTFTTILAEHLARLSGRPAREAQDGEEVNAGTIYVAPGGKHMRVVRRDGIAVIALDDGALINFCKPAVDPLFASAAQVWGHWVLGLVLTGMGSDGLRGAQAITAAGGSVMAQDEASSVVWGMPGQVSMAGLCSAVLPLKEIAPRLSRVFAGEKS
jgi:two-component system, chemotaxis family, protein-glutamate methylesterase/glutaminase